MYTYKSQVAFTNKQLSDRLVALTHTDHQGAVTQCRSCSQVVSALLASKPSVVPPPNLPVSCSPSHWLDSPYHSNPWSGQGAPLMHKFVHWASNK